MSETGSTIDPVPSEEEAAAIFAVLALASPAPPVDDGAGGDGDAGTRWRGASRVYGDDAFDRDRLRMPW